MRFFVFLLLISYSLLSVSKESAADSATQTAKHYFKDSVFENLYLSPDGEHLAMTAPIKGLLSAVILKTKDNSVVNYFYPDENMSIYSIKWLSNNRVELKLSREYGSLEQPYHDSTIRVNIDGSFRKEGEKGYILDLLPENPDYMLTVKRSRDGYPTIYRTWKQKNRSLKRERLRFNSGFIIDSTTTPRIAYHDPEKDGNAEVHYRKSKDHDWQKIFTIDDKKGNLNFLKFASDDKHLYAYDGREGSKGYYLYNPETSEAKLLHKIDNHDSRSTIYDGAFNDPEPIGVRSQPGRFEVTYFNPEDDYPKLLSQIQASFPDQLVVAQEKTQDKKFALLAVFSDKNPGDYYLLDIEKKGLRFLISKRPWMKSKQLATMEPFRFKTRDNLELHGYITRPVDAKGPTPMVVVVHGGPYGVRDSWGYNPEVQFLASKGYSVLQINFRGSAGYGVEAQHAAYRKQGVEMQDDITDGTLWAIEQGYADKNRICIYGASYGAYSAMMGSIREPDMYKCAVAYAGVYDIRKQERSDTVRSKWGRIFLDEAWNINDEKWTTERSPVFHLDKLKNALFIVHGKKDPRTPYKNYVSLTEKLDDIKYPYESLVKDNEVHGFVDEANKIELYDMMADFLDRHIGY